MRPDHPRIPHQQQELPYLRLEHHDHGNKPHADELPQDLAEQLHLQHLYHLPEQVNGNDAGEDPDGCRALYQVVNFIKDQRKQDDVDEINDP